MLQLIFLMLSVLSLSFCGEIVATTYPVYYPLKYLVGEKHRLEVLVRSQADPHHYELTPKDAERLLGANLVMTLGLESWEWRLLKNLPKGKVVTLSEGINLLKRGSFPDPHVWLSPKEYRVVVRNIKDALVRWDPSQRAYYQERYSQYLQRLNSLDRKLESTLKTCSYRTLVSTHRAWDYLSRDYGIKTLSLSGVHAEEEPKPSEIKAIVQTVKREGLKYIFAEVGQDRKVADFIASQTGTRVLMLNSSLFPQLNSDDYFSIMERNLRALREGLGCR
ncbi:periplasmic solute binding protein [Hydrogenobacter thermophilus TK-6]|uniref:ABC-type metal ion transport system periplasmic component/surface adhesin n=1 Tax=Hydrogenobacter thermophilus (strain DSM 6534 / IAM 12695 / TK-6) TaxID=608538 RepID=D3DFB1_HYDTT|nr:metal ABC transporter substrate-binding protein [Hydrogenobacter thermophilus]ADO44457.1 periplasmic solute binding protein [Hydrogenobacter thermophilus TK-6]BAI68513.1 ABC-type metal ion transport system periplasmic component/surface adhesin [Hydrogenobacter thermophilus TK-6]